jgi:hypothetical protein
MIVNRTYKVVGPRTIELNKQRYAPGSEFEAELHPAKERLLIDSGQIAQAKEASVQEILNQVGQDRALAQSTLAAEEAKGDGARAQLVKGLRKIIDPEEG